jgi:hypothetical protein
VNKSLPIFIIKLLVYSIIIYLLYNLVKAQIPPKFYFEKTPYLIVFFFLLTLVFHFGLIRSSAKSNRSIVTYYMTATALKFFMLLAIIIIYAFTHRGQSAAFIGNFFMLYVMFTIYEVATVYFQFSSKRAKDL